MLGAIAGDIIGSGYAADNTSDPSIPLFTERSTFTGNTVLALAVADHLVTGQRLADLFHEALEQYASCAWDDTFLAFVSSRTREPHNTPSAVTHVGTVAWWSTTCRDVLDLAASIAAVTHAHPQSIEGAQATALATWIGLGGGEREDIRKEIGGRFGYDLETPLADRRRARTFDASCHGIVPMAIRAVLEADRFEAAIRNAVCPGGDSATLAAIAGSIAEPVFGAPDSIAVPALDRLPLPMHAVLCRFLGKLEREGVNAA